MKDWLKNCTTITTKKIIKAEENKRQFILENPQNKEIIKTQVDGCLDIDGKRCDWLFEQNEHGQYFVELKGKHINHAFEQLENTLKVFKQKQLLQPKLTLVIVLSQYPKTTTNVQRWKKQLSKNFGATFIIQNNIVKVKI